MLRHGGGRDAVARVGGSARLSSCSSHPSAHPRPLRKAPVQHETSPSAVTLIRAAQLSDTAEYAYAATAPAGSRLIFLAGSCPLEADGSTAAVGDYAGQAAQCMANLAAALAAAGASLTDVISTRVLVATTSQADLVAAWEVVRDAFGDHDAPSTLLGVTVLGYDHQLVEIEAVAAVRE
ncbi:RidA family protein [Arthrobacter jiangjiafuii]|uniref:RidA family protein n=1 Tax=Arthrobacter jiangjiafuii TaxID=2817475 RepID=A0A975M7G8_9MICC|nr:RidA family protein [Arthrobacter jiangjiafuii]QWC11365.1 RidA family protein [Arthrobacter jiangjiafuii]